MAHFLRKMKHILWGHGASETPPPTRFLSACWAGSGCGEEKTPVLCALSSQGLMRKQATIEAARRGPRRWNSYRHPGR